MHCIFTETKKPGLLLGRSISNRHLAILMITASNNRKLVKRHLSVISLLKLVAVLDIASSKCSKEMSQCCMERRPFGLPHNASDACIGFDKRITKVIVQLIKKGKSDGAKSLM